MQSAVLLFLNIGSGELVVILFVALMLFGGNKLPELARGLGKGIRDFKDASEGVKREIHNQINNFDENKAPEQIENKSEDFENHTDVSDVSTTTTEPAKTTKEEY